MVGIAQTGTQRGPIELTDEFVEHSQVVEAALDIMYDSEIKSFADDKLYHHVIEFARKYDISSILKTISSQLRAHATSSDKGNFLRLLRVAIDLGECSLISAIVGATCGHVWPEISIEYEAMRARQALSILANESSTLLLNPKPVVSRKPPTDKSIFPSKPLSLPSPNLDIAAKEYVEGEKAFDLGTWPYEEFASLPTPLAWALLRADQLAKKEYSLDRTVAFGRKIQDILDTMCELVSCLRDDF